MTEAYAPVTEWVPESGSVRRVAVGAAGAMAGIALIVSVSGFESWIFWRSYSVVSDVLARRREVADVVAVDHLNRTLWFVVLGTSLLGLGLVVQWLWQARRNAEAMALAEHRLGRGWVIGGFFVPLAAFRYPYVAVVDIWRTSRPGAGMTGLDALPGSPLVRVWWGFWLAARVLQTFAITRFLMIRELADLDIAATIMSIAAGFMVVAGVLLAAIVFRITVWQNRVADGRAL